MKFVGIDLPQKTIVLCVKDQERRVLDRRTFACAVPEGIRAFFAQLGPFQAVVEATASYEWLWQLLQPLAEQLVLAHPGKLRLIAESARKSDRLDAEVLADFLALGLIPRAYRPTPRQRDHRTLVRHRVAVQQHQSRLKCRIRRLVAHDNAGRPKLFSAEGREYLARLKLATADRFVLDHLLASLDHGQRQLRAAGRQLRTFARTSPDRDREARALLRTIPGVGEIVSEVVLAELGDWRRFSSQKKVMAYAGLVPGLRSSAGRAKELGITKQGSRLLRWALVEGAWQTIRYSLRWEAIYRRLKEHRGSKKAVVAVARRLLGVMLALLKSGQGYQLAPQERPQSLRGQAAAAEGEA